MQATEAEPNGGGRLSTGPVPERFAGGGDVVLDLGDAELLHVRHVLEVLVARAKAGGTAEVVDRDCVVAGLGEPLGQLAVERVEAADVGKDHDPRSVSLGGLGQ